MKRLFIILGILFQFGLANSAIQSNGGLRIFRCSISESPDSTLEVYSSDPAADGPGTIFQRAPRTGKVDLRFEFLPPESKKTAAIMISSEYKIDGNEISYFFKLGNEEIKGILIYNEIEFRKFTLNDKKEPLRKFECEEH